MNEVPARLPPVEVFFDETSLQLADDPRCAHVPLGRRGGKRELPRSGLALLELALYTARYRRKKQLEKMHYGTSLGDVELMA